jgi:hypothetical protein
MDSPYQRWIDLAEDRIQMFQDGRLETWDLQPARRNTTLESIAAERATIERLRPAAETMAGLHA